MKQRLLHGVITKVISFTLSMKAADFEQYILHNEQISTINIKMNE